MFVGSNNIGPALPFYAVIRGTTGQLNITIDGGQLILAGQSVEVSFGATYAIVNRTLGPALPFSPTLRGQTLAASVAVAIDAGQVTLTGQSIQVDVQAPRTGAVKWDPGPYFDFLPRRPAFTPLQPGSITIPIDTAGQITLSGQTMGIAYGVPIAAGQVTVAGQSITVRLTVNIDAGSIVLQGQSISTAVGGSINVGFSAGLLTLQGQDVDITIDSGTTTITIRLQIEEYHATMSLEFYHMTLNWL